MKPSDTSTTSKTESFFMDEEFPFFSELNVSTIPPVNIIKREALYEMQMALPGLQLEQLNALIQNGILSIFGRKKVEHTSDIEQNELSYTRREFSFHWYQRSFGIPEDVNPARIFGIYSNGLLTLTLPKYGEHETPSSIELLKIPVYKGSCTVCTTQHEH